MSRGTVRLGTAVAVGAGMIVAGALGDRIGLDALPLQAVLIAVGIVVSSICITLLIPASPRETGAWRSRSTDSKTPSVIAWIFVAFGLVLVLVAAGGMAGDPTSPAISWFGLGGLALASGTAGLRARRAFRRGASPREDPPKTP